MILFLLDCLAKNNPSHLQYLKYLKSGSYNIKDLKVTRDIKRNVHPNNDLLVIKSMGALSQKLGSKDLYFLHIALILNKNDGIYEFLLGSLFVHIVVE